MPGQAITQEELAALYEEHGGFDEASLDEFLSLRDKILANADVYDTDAPVSDSLSRLKSTPSLPNTRGKTAAD